MKHWILFVFVLLLSACNLSIPTEEDLARRKIEDRIESMQFFKEPQSGLCFAYFWQGYAAEGGPALASVPCDKVEKTAKFVK